MKTLSILVLYLSSSSLFGQGQLTGIEFWFDQNHSERIFQDVPPNTDGYIETIENFVVSNLKPGFHYGHFRLKDSNNNWSSIITWPFFLQSEDLNKLVKLRIWSDQGLHPNDLFEIPLTANSQYLKLSNILDLCRLDDSGSIPVFFQLGDTNGNWSSVIAKLVNVDVVGQPPTTIGDILGDSIICFNHPNTYTVDLVPGAASFTWLSPAQWQSNTSFNTLEIIPDVNDGIIQVYAANACGTSNTASILIEVNTATPAQADTIYGELKVCAGDQVTYSIMTIPDANGYLWDVPPGWTVENTSPLTSITVGVGLVSGDIKVTAMNACGSSATTSIHVEVTPQKPQTPIIDGPLFVCTESLISYSVPSDFLAESYYWTFPAEWSVYDTISPSHFQFLTGGLGGQISVTTENICGSSDPDNILIHVSQSVPLIGDTITGLIHPCEGDQEWYQLSTGIDALNYYWEWPNDWLALTPIDSNAILFQIENHSDALSVFANNACGNSDTITIAISVPQIDTTVNRHGDTLISGQLNAEYRWMSCPEMQYIDGAVNSFFIPQQPGGYAVEVSQASCVDTSECFIITGSLNLTNAHNNISVFPNPTNGVINITSDKHEEISIELFNTIGQSTPFREKRNNDGLEVHIASEIPGLYLLKIRSRNRFYSQLIIKI